MPTETPLRERPSLLLELSGRTTVSSDLAQLDTDALVGEYFRLRMQGPVGMSNPRYNVLEQLMEERDVLGAYF